MSFLSFNISSSPRPTTRFNPINNFIYLLSSQKQMSNMNILAAIEANDRNRLISLINEQGQRILNLPGIYTPLMYAAYMGNPDIVQILLDSGAHVNGRNDMGYTPLMAAAEQGHGNIVDILLDSGADVHIRALGGMTALLHAVPYPDIFRLLLQHTVSPPLITLLDHAIETRSFPTIRLLVEERGANMAVALQQRVSDPNDVNIIRLLIVQGLFNVNDSSLRGQTLLYKAILSQNIDMVHMLIEQGADLYYVDPSGRTPLEYAEEMLHNSPNNSDLADIVYLLEWAQDYPRLLESPDYPRLFEESKERGSPPRRRRHF
jgi:ankyrin repeat protein